MKKLLPIFSFVMLANLIVAQVVKTINITTPGTLTNVLTANEKTTITDFNITGTINALDIQCMRDELVALTNLDLSGVNIAAYNGSGTYSSSNPANELPDMSFYRMTPELKKLSLHNVVLPTTITAIGMLSFYGCSSLEKIFCLINIPPTVKNMALSGISPTIYIPNGKTAIYKAIAQWQNFNFIEYSVSTGGTNDYSINNEIHFYPNPVKNELRIDCEGGSIFEIQNLSGQTVYTGDLNKSSVIYTSNFSAGVYLVKIQKGTMFKYIKIIKSE